jgi:signal transduction histidine kinase/HAMP domain-containing protein
MAAPTVWRDTVSVNRTGLPVVRALWRRLTLWPRLAIGVTIGFVVLFAGFSILGIRAVDASTNRILHERLAITEELAEDFDGLLQHRFSDLTAFDARPSTPAVKHRLMAEIYHASGGAFTSLFLVDRQGTVVTALGPGAPTAGSALGGKPYVANVLANGRRTVSGPFRDSRGRPVVALAVQVRGQGALVGTLDLAGPDVTERLDAARRLGTTGHAELVGPNGMALASTEPGAALVPGEHLAFYREMLKSDLPGIANVPVTAGRNEPPSLRRERHAMAFVRLSNAPWAVALGGTESETYAPARHLRRTLMLAGGGSLAALWLLTLLGARLLVRPVRDLTRAAEQMASGNLERTVSVSEGGEIGVLAESLETMRAQLKDSLETVRRWGAELELKVADRTAELNARNRQLAAVSAILAAADETHDLDEMLRRFLDVVLAESGMDAAAVRLDSGRTVAARGGWRDFPCEGCAGAAEDAPLYLTARARERLHPDCTLAEEALVLLPLRGPSGVLGVLALGRKHGWLPTAQERPILAAICDQIAVAVENTRLAEELHRLEAQHEVQRMRNELISAVSHELRTPLGFIKGYATTLLREDTPIEPGTRRQFLEIIDEETDKLEHMIGELLDVSRLQAGRLPIERTPVALGGLVAHSVDKARRALEESEHTVAVTLPGEDVTVLADPLRIEQVLDNLLENAGRYSDPRSPVEIDLSVEDGYAVVSITDKGDGIPAAELEQVFEPFYRGDNAKKRNVRGAGLGLAICRGIVEAHGGKIWSENGHDRTTTFVLTLPLAGTAA